MELSITLLTIILTLMDTPLYRLFRIIKLIISIIIGYGIFIIYNKHANEVSYVFLNPKQYSFSILIDAFSESGKGWDVALISATVYISIYIVLRWCLSMIIDKYAVPYFKRHEHKFRISKAAYFKTMKKAVRKTLLTRKSKHLKYFPYQKIKEDFLDKSVLIFSIVLALIILQSVIYWMLVVYLIFLIFMVFTIAFYNVTDPYMNKITKHEYKFARRNNDSSDF